MDPETTIKEIIIREVVAVTPATLWEIVGVLIGGATLILFAIILWYTRRTAIESQRANDRAQLEMDVRITPFISVPSLQYEAVYDGGGEIVLRKNPLSGNLDLASRRDLPDSMIVVQRLSMKNSGLSAASYVGYNYETGFNRNDVLAALRAGTTFGADLIPPDATVTYDIDIPFGDLKISLGDSSKPYYVAFGVAYKNHKNQGRLVEVQWAMTGINILMESHSLPQPYDMADNL